jgi:hypothetical protein
VRKRAPLCPTDCVPVYAKSSPYNSKPRKGVREQMSSSNVRERVTRVGVRVLGGGVVGALALGGGPAEAAKTQSHGNHDAHAVPRRRSRGSRVRRTAPPGLAAPLARRAQPASPVHRASSAPPVRKVRPVRSVPRVRRDPKVRQGPRASPVPLVPLGPSVPPVCRVRPVPRARLAPRARKDHRARLDPWALQAPRA